MGDADVIATVAAHTAPPPLGSLLAGFLVLVAGIAVLTMAPRRAPPEAGPATGRALAYGLTYALSLVGFAPVLGPALFGHERSPWLLALGDVIFLTFGLFTWVTVLVEGHPPQAFGLRRLPAGRLFPTLIMGVGAAAVYSYGPYAAVATYQVHSTPDTLVFALLWAAAGSAIPEEVLFRGLLMSSLDRRVSHWARIALPALAFAAARAVRVLPGPQLGAPEWLGYVFGLALPLGLWWGIMRELAGGVIWPCIASNFLVEFGPALAGTSPSPL